MKLYNSNGELIQTTPAPENKKAVFNSDPNRKLSIRERNRKRQEELYIRLLREYIAEKQSLLNSYKNIELTDNDKYKLAFNLPSITDAMNSIEANRPELYQLKIQNKEFERLANDISELQHQYIIAGGLSKLYDSRIASLILQTKHGYETKQKQEHDIGDKARQLIEELQGRSRNLLEDNAQNNPITDK